VNVSDANSVWNLYKDMKVGSVYFDNLWSMIEWSQSRPWNKLGTPVAAREWQMTSQTVNANNDLASNSIVIPAGILQVPYFHPDLPSYINFGGSGWTIGHEISHAFDNVGRQYDAEGRFGSDWWTNKTDTEFRRRSQCFIDQYGNFTVPGINDTLLHVNGAQTLAENIADAGGIDNTFLAWQQHREDHPDQDKDLPGLESWTHEQLYFISFANQWCKSQTEASLIDTVRGDVHSPNKFRIKGTLQNSVYFRQHFNCPSKEPTCKIW